MSGVKTDRFQNRHNARFGADTFFDTGFDQDNGDVIHVATVRSPFFQPAQPVEPFLSQRVTVTQA
jgi:hypothetical protein